MRSINVQQNPGRGAKAVVIKGRSAVFKKRTVNLDGAGGHSIIKVQVRFALGPVFKVEILVMYTEVTFTSTNCIW